MNDYMERTTKSRGDNPGPPGVPGPPGEIVFCKDCDYLEYSDCYGECGRGYLGVVKPYDYCSRGKQRSKEGKPMTGNEYQYFALRTANDDDEALDRIVNGVMGLNGEAGECIDIVKKHLFQGHPLNIDKLIDELGDVLWYVAITADGLGVPLENVMLHNIEKLRRRYPEGFDAERSIHREENE